MTFQILDKIFPAVITDLILSYLCTRHFKYDKKLNFSRMFFNHRDEYDLPVPKPNFRKSIWMNRFLNSYMPEGVKLHAFHEVNIDPSKRHVIIVRAYEKLHIRIICDCIAPQGRSHFFQHWIDALFKKINTFTPIEIKRKGIDISIPSMLLALQNLLMKVHLWDDLERVENTIIKYMVDGKYQAMWLASTTEFNSFQIFSSKEFYLIRNLFYAFLIW